MQYFPGTDPDSRASFSDNQYIFLGQIYQLPSDQIIRSTTVDDLRLYTYDKWTLVVRIDDQMTCGGKMALLDVDKDDTRIFIVFDLYNPTKASYFNTVITFENKSICIIEIVASNLLRGSALGKGYKRLCI